MEHFGDSIDYTVAVLFGLHLLVLFDSLIAVYLLEEFRDNQIESLHLDVFVVGLAHRLILLGFASLHKNITMTSEEADEGAGEILRNVMFHACISE